MRYSAPAASEASRFDAARSNAGTARSWIVSTSDEPGTSQGTRLDLTWSTVRPNMAASSPLRSSPPAIHPRFSAWGVVTRCAPHELDSVNEGHASPSPPVAPAGSDNPRIDNATTPTVTCTDSDDRPLRCTGTFQPMIQNQNPCVASLSTIWSTADRHFVRRHFRWWRSPHAGRFRLANQAPRCAACLTCPVSRPPGPGGQKPPPR